MNLKIKNALISVSNKESWFRLKTLKKFNNIISSGGPYISIKAGISMYAI